MCLMIIYSLEDKLFIDHGYPLKKRTAVKFIADFIGNSESMDKVNVQGLIDLAKLRLALYKIGIEVGNVIKGNAKLEHSWLKPVQELLGNDQSESLKKYLLMLSYEMFANSKYIHKVWHPCTAQLRCPLHDL